MANQSEPPLDRLWAEYAQVFCDFDDTTLARWMAQTLGQLQGRVWRLSHPLLGAYRLAAQVAHERQVWLKRLATSPSAYPIAPCCRAPLLPLVTRDVLESGLVCQHCSGTAAAWDDLPAELQPPLKDWAERYSPVHAVAHQDESRRLPTAEQEREFETAAREAEKLLARVGRDILPKFLDYFPAAVWEDQDECLEVQPEDIPI